MKFRLVYGQAVVLVKNSRGELEERMFRQGSRIETTTNLSKRFPEKFVRIGDGEPIDEGELWLVNPGDPNLDDYSPDLPLGSTDLEKLDAQQAAAQAGNKDSKRYKDYQAMSIEDLQGIAFDEEISLGNAKSKKDIIAKMMEHGNLASIVNQ